MVQRSTILVEGPLAVRTQRHAAASAAAMGREISTIPQLAIQLAGGFVSLPGPEGMYPAISQALALGGFAELDAVRELPGTPRAIARALDLVWRADLDLRARAANSPRLADLRLIEQRVEETLPVGRLLPRRLRDLAVGRAAFAPRLTGAIHVHGLMTIDPIWRPFINALAAVVDVTWTIPDAGDRSWFSGTVLQPQLRAGPIESADVCADPRGEVLEALRWARERLSRGGTAAADIAIAATAPDAWDDHFLVLAIEAGLPVHFSHGIPALSTAEGQACAALADVLVNGLNQQRVRRLLRRLPASGLRDHLPQNWGAKLPSSAGLFTVDHWCRALSAEPTTESDDTTLSVLIPVLEVLARGTVAAEEAGNLLFQGQSCLFWEEALRIAPAEAINLSLSDLRVPDRLDPANSVVWGPASHLASSPRPLIRLLGLSSGSWPRRESEDPILPEHVIAPRSLEPESLAERDRRTFDVIRLHATGGIWLSRARRSSAGSLQAASSLWPSTGERNLTRTRVPEHAFSETDRLLARPEEAGRSPALIASRLCWRDWHQPRLTPHDAIRGENQPALLRALEHVQSVTRIRRLLRDPIGFVWRYAFGWRAPVFEQQPLTLPASEFGELVHELLSRTVQALEPSPGLAGARPTDIQRTLDAAVDAVFDRWPLERAVPPALLWRYTLDQAARLAFRGLTVEEVAGPDAQSWGEIPFGEETASLGHWPWLTTRPIAIGETGIRFGGRIDRVDLSARAQRVLISDYKTGSIPKDSTAIILARGTELQRVLYAVAARQLLTDDIRITSRLLYLRDESAPVTLEGDALDEAMTDLGRFIAAARNLVLAGNAVSGPDAHERFHDMRLALPADSAAYLQRKQAVFATANAAIADLWSRR